MNDLSLRNVLPSAEMSTVEVAVVPLIGGNKELRMDKTTQRLLGQVSVGLMEVWWVEMVAGRRMKAKTRPKSLPRAAGLGIARYSLIIAHCV
jgi:hypothetical protein